MAEDKGTPEPEKRAQDPAESPAGKAAPKDEPTRRPGARKQAAAEPAPPRKGPSRLRAGSDAARSQLARVVRIVTVLLAVVLAVGALLVAFKANVNQDNPVVRFVTDLADSVSGPFSRGNGVFDFGGKNGDAKNALVNWGIAAIVYLGVGRIVANVIAPSGGTNARR